jgi:dihydroorotate dehydrogenase electron transfer subunit
MKQLKAKITENKQVAPDFYKMRVESPYLAKASMAGQFVEIRCSDGLDPLLRRPFGVHRILPKGIEMLYEVVGKGTKILSFKKPGEMVDILGPLGNGFMLNPNRTAILIGGGIGIAPLPALAEGLRKRGGKVHVIIGAKKSPHILCDKEFKSLGCSVSVATEDGSKGKKGLVTDILKNFFTQYSILNTQYAIYACGPNGMLKAIYDIAKPKNIPCQFSFESHMACGVGVCLGCPVKVKSQTQHATRNTHHATHNTQHEYKMVCKDGPVFNGEDVVW